MFETRSCNRLHEGQQEGTILSIPVIMIAAIDFNVSHLGPGSDRHGLSGIGIENLSSKAKGYLLWKFNWFYHFHVAGD